MITFFSPFEVSLFDIDSVFKDTNKVVGQYLLDKGLPITFDFKDKFNKALYTHEFIKAVCNLIKSYPSTSRPFIIYNNILTKDEFRNNLLKKIQRIFGIKIFNGIWDIRTFKDLLLDCSVHVYDDFEKLVNCDCKPKSFKHIKKYLEKEGLTNLNDVYFKDISNIMAVCC